MNICFDLDATRSPLPVYEFDGAWDKVKLSDKTEKETESMYWKSVGKCKNGHIMLCYNIVKQVHCPVCEPGIDMNKHWTDWGEKCQCGKA